MSSTSETEQIYIEIAHKVMKALFAKVSDVVGSNVSDSVEHELMRETQESIGDKVRDNVREVSYTLYFVSNPAHLP